MKYDAAYFIAKFEAIPEEKWTTQKFVAAKDQSCRCALGHCGRLSASIDTPEAVGLCELDSQFPTAGTIVGVNDGGNRKYQQPTPKQRVLAWLRDAQEAGL